MQQKNDFSKGSIPRLIWKLSLPMIVAQLINALYNIVDRIYIGNIPQIGGVALTGVGLTFPILMLISAFAALAGFGGAPLASIRRGEGDDEGAERIMGNSLTLLVLFGVVVMAFFLIFKEEMLRLFGTSEETFPYANEYLTIYLFGSIFVMITLGLNSFINAQGFTKIGMLTVVIGAAVNIVLDPIFIFLLDMGVSGAALATILSQFISAVWAILFLCGKKSILKLRRKNFRLSRKVVGPMLALGLSPFIMQSTESLLMITFNTNLKLFGADIHLTTMTVLSSLMQVLILPMQGFTQGAQPIIGYNYGAKAYSRVRQALKWLVCICMTYSVVTWGIMHLFPEALIRVFNSDAALLEAAVPALHTYFAMQFMMGLQISTQQSFMALGKAKQAILFALLRKIILLIPLILLLPRAFGLGVHGIFLAEPISDTISASCCFITFMITVWPKLKQPDAIALQE
ncbi:MAG: MATE family efflux transporter [Clostridia bacterium]|nr:MATE family efflux transporter [Clostridia bacterium]